VGYSGQVFGGRPRQEVSVARRKGQEKHQQKKKKKLKLEKNPLSDLPLKQQDVQNVRGARAAPFTVGYSKGQM
jgi:hypothetical protein